MCFFLSCLQLFLFCLQPEVTANLSFNNYTFRCVHVCVCGLVYFFKEHQACACSCLRFKFKTFTTSNFLIRTLENLRITKCLRDHILNPSIIVSHIYTTL